MIKIRLLQVVVSLFCIITATASFAIDMDIKAANDYMRAIRKSMDSKPVDFNNLKHMLDNLENLTDQAVSCVDSANAQLLAISDIEKDNGLTDHLIENSEDALYIRDKKQFQVNKLSHCRLFLFKSRDLTLDLKEVIHAATQSDMLTVSEPMWQVLSHRDGDPRDIANLIIVGLATISIIWCLWLIPTLKFIRRFTSKWPKQIASIYRVLLSVVSIVIITLELVGYRQLAVYLSQGALLTVGLLLLFMIIVYVGNTLFVQEKLLRSMIITKKHKFMEVKLLKFSLYALIASWFVLLLLEWWGVPVASVDKVKGLLLNGETVYGIKIIPMRLLIALLAFSLIQIVGKYLAVYISRQNKFEGETETQVVIGSLITYMVFSVALICGLLVSGVDFTGLAIVAGALSVGIGLGLQNVVNNFVSGLILLIEKPIKPGDRIMIKGIEGFVKKISIRSTRIVSLLKEDVIIPNSDLITNPIINYVFNDTLSRLKCKVGVAYDSNVDLVKETLLNVALKHHDVLNDPLNHPTVVLEEFADSCLVFELLCVVNDVNKKYAIASEINIMIVKAFRENGVVMAFPQLDVHIVPATT
jgi:small-conductance mechanosensitive channel